MSDAEELDFELITNIGMLAPPPPLRNETVTVPEWKTTSGKAARFLAWELTANDFADYVESGRVYKNNVLQRYNQRDEDVRFLSYTLRDQHGHRLWNKVEEAKVQLGRLGRSSLSELVAAANRVNSAKESATEGNSEEIQSDS